PRAQQREGLAARRARVAKPACAVVRRVQGLSPRGLGLARAASVAEARGPISRGGTRSPHERRNGIIARGRTGLTRPRDITLDAPITPLLAPWAAPFGLPPFDLVRPEHFRPAFERGMREHRDELARIAGQPEAPGFDNTLAAFDASGRLLSRVEALFHNLAASATSDALQAVQREMAAPLAAHWSGGGHEP